MLKQIQQRIFGHPPTEKTTQLVAGLSWSFIGVILTSPILMVVSIALGRLLGPEDYGYYSIVITVANILAVLTNFSFDQAAIKLSSGDQKFKTNPAYFVNSFLVTISTSALVGILLLLFASPLSHLLGGLPGNVLIFAFVYSLVLAVRQTADAYIRTRGLFKYQAGVKIAETATLTALFVVIFIVVKHRTFEAYLTLLIGSLVLTIILYLIKIRDRLSLMWNKEIVASAWRYARIGGVVSILGFVAQNLDRFFIKANLGASELGVYAAYLLIPTNVSTIIATAVSNVFFPMMSAMPTKKAVLQRVNILFLYASPVVVLIFFVLGYLTIHFFGSQYRINLLELLLAALYGTTLVYLALTSAIITSSTRMFAAYLKMLPIKLILVVVAFSLLAKFTALNATSVLLIAIGNLIVDGILLNKSLFTVESNRGENLVEEAQI